jgi:DNA ligase D-like protein (predicted ligase)
MRAIKPMLAVMGSPFSSEAWIFEPKIDGTRCIAFIGERVELQNRRLRPITHRYPEVIAELKAAARGCILDGELAVFLRGRPNFAALEEREHQGQNLRIDYLSRAKPASYLVFDVLYAGEWIMDRPLLERKSILKEELAEGERVSIIDFMHEEGEAYYQAALKMGLEGVMAKRSASTYQPGIRSPDWKKIKKGLSADLVVGGFIPGKGYRKAYFGGLLLGAYQSGKPVFVGRVGSGFSRQELEEIAGDFQSLDSPPFSNPPRLSGARWLKPEIVVQVAALEVTAKGNLRAPVFLRRRFDKHPRECTLDQVMGGSRRSQSTSLEQKGDEVDAV